MAVDAQVVCFVAGKRLYRKLAREELLFPEGEPEEVPLSRQVVVGAG